MADSTFIVTDPKAPVRVAGPYIQQKAQQIARLAASRTPVRTGRLRAGWKTEKTAEASVQVSNDVSYAVFVEYGTRRQPPVAMLGEAIALAAHR